MEMTVDMNYLIRVTWDASNHNSHYTFKNQEWQHSARGLSHVFSTPMLMMFLESASAAYREAIPEWILLVQCSGTLWSLPNMLSRLFLDWHTARSRSFLLVPDRYLMSLDDATLLALSPS